MEKLLYNVSQILGTAIIHSLWQGLLIYTVLRLIFLAVLGLSAEKKHNLAMLALFSMVGWFGYTFYVEFNAYDWSPTVTNYQLSDSVSLALYNTYTATAPLHPTTLEDYKAEFFSAIKTYLPYITALYTIGLLFNLGRLGLAWNQIRVIKQNMIGNLMLQQQVNNLAKNLGIRKSVQLSFSERVDGPCVISFIKPILLLPVTITTQLSAEEVEAILIHELAHIQSNDYLLNILQQVITVLLFFNPFTILISRIISTERENRCDDIVVKTTGDPLIYAQALLKLEETRQTNLTLALAATGKKYHLLTRIERIMKSNKPTGNFKHLILAMVILAGSLGSISWLNPEIENGKIVLKRTAAKVLPASIDARGAQTAVSKTSPKKKSHFTIVAADTTRIMQLIDTPKKVKKNSFKIVLEDGDGNKKEYSSVNDLPADARKEFLNENLNINRGLKFNIDTAHLGYMATNFKNDFKFNTDRMIANSKTIKERNEKYKANMKKHAADMKLLDKGMLKYKNDMKLFDKDMLKFNKDMKKHNADMQKMYSSPEWKKQIAEITKLSTNFAQNFTSDKDWAKNLEELGKVSGKFSQDFINNPDWKKHQDEIVKQALDIARAQQDKAGAETRQKTREMADKIREETRKAYEEANKHNVIYSKKTQEAISREVEEAWKKAQDRSKVAKPEKAEKPEKPEAAEKPERPERPEVPETQSKQ